MPVSSFRALARTTLLSLVLFAPFSFGSPLEELLKLQEEMATTQVTIWNGLSDIFKPVRQGAPGRFYEQSSVFYSPLMNAVLLSHSSALLKRINESKESLEGERYAAWLASTQIMATLKTMLVVLNQDPKTSGVNARLAQSYSTITGNVFDQYAAKLTFAVPLLNAQHATSRRFTADFVEMRKHFSSPGAKVNRWTIFLALTDQGGSMSWQEPHLENLEKIVEIANTTNDSTVRYLALAKLAQIAKYQFKDGRDRLREEFVPLFTKMAQDPKHSWGLRALAYYSLITSLPNKEAALATLPAFLELKAPGSITTLEERLGYFLIAEGMTDPSDFRADTIVRRNIHAVITALAVLFPQECRANIAEMGKPLRESN